MKTSAGSPKVRDTVFLGVGTFMLLYQLITERVSVILVGAALAILGVPGGIGVSHLLRGRQGTPDTPEPSSSSASPSSSRHSRSSPPTAD